jgi:hypothetical protein
MAKKPARAVYALEEGEVLAGLKNADKIDPQKIGEALQRLRDRDGEADPKRFAEEARNPRHPAHRHLEWDDAKCGVLYRIEQARCLIRVIRIEHSEEFYRAFVSVPKKDGGRQYVSFGDVLSSRELQDALLAQAQQDLEVWQQRYRELREIVELVRPALVALTKRRKPRGGDELPQPSA